MSEIFWVYYEKFTGNIKRISGKDEIISGLSKISVSYEQIKDIYEGKKSFNDYKVEYNVHQKEYIFQAIDKERIINLKKFIELSNDTINPELSIIQNIGKKMWEIKLDKKIAKKMLKEDFNANTVLPFSVTKKGNPHLLYRFIKLDLYFLVYNKTEKIYFTNDEEFGDVSVYTSKHFDSYLHKVKK